MTKADAPRILLIEPDAPSAAAIARAFSEVDDVQLISVGTAAEARAAGATDPVTIVLTALKLPDATALDLLTSPFESGPTPIALLVATEAEIKECRGLLKSGAFDYVIKHESSLADLPFRTSRLIANWRLWNQQLSADEALREKEAFNFALFQHNPAAMVVVDGAGRVLKSNLARRQMEEVLPALGEPLYSATGDEMERTLAAALVSCISWGVVKTFPDIAWAGRWLNITMAPFPHGAVVIQEDITARKEAEAEAEHRQQQLMHADKMIALGTLVSGVAHEIANPNNAMILSASSLKRLCDDLLPVLDRLSEVDGDFDVGMRSYSEAREELPELIGIVGRAAARIKGLVDDLKTYARKGPDTLAETVDINRVLEEATKLMSPLIRSSTNHFTLEKAERLPALAGNARQLEQVVINLLTNACQALSSPDQHIAASVRWDAATEAIVVEVRDGGVGMAAENLVRITDPFFTTKHDQGGTGLGLSISRTIVERHHGQLLFTSQPGRGTVAAIRLPIIKSESDVPAAPETGGTSAS